MSYVCRLDWRPLCFERMNCEMLLPWLTLARGSTWMERYMALVPPPIGSEFSMNLWKAVFISGSVACFAMFYLRSVEW